MLFPMSRYLHTLSAVIFYILGSSVFLAYVMARNSIGAEAPAMWLRIADLPLLATGMLYGGLSVYLNLKADDSASHILAIIIGLPLAALFVVFAVLNFWPSL